MSEPRLVGTLGDQAHALLRERILSGAMPAGSRIREIQLAADLGVSRGTLRSALQQLAAERLVVQNRFRSTHVASPSAADVFETYTLRNALEALAARLAAQRITDAGAQRLRDILGSMETAVARDDRAAVVDADGALHHAIIELAGHSLLSEHYATLETQTRLYLTLTSAHDYDLPEILRVHRELADAVIAGDADLAAALGADHSTPDGEAIVQRLREAAASAADTEAAAPASAALTTTQHPDEETPA